MNAKRSLRQFEKVDRLRRIGGPRVPQCLRGDASKRLDLFLSQAEILANLLRVFSLVQGKIVEIAERFEGISDLVHDLEGELTRKRTFISYR